MAATGEAHELDPPGRYAHRVARWVGLFVVAALFALPAVSRAADQQVSSGAIDPGYADSRGFVDATADGKADYCRLVGGPPPYLVTCLKSTGDGFAGTVDSAGLDPGYGGTRHWVDVTGDGRADYCRNVGDSSIQEIACTTSGDNSIGASTVSGPLTWGVDPQYVDFNGDGRLDYCTLVDPSSGPSHVECTVRTASGWGTTIPSPQLDRGYNGTHMWGDVNGDGRVDYCREVGDPPSFSIRCTLSTGTGFGTDVSVAGFESNTGLMLDYDGDRKADYCRPIDSKIACTVSTGTGFGNTVISAPTDFGQADGRAWADFNGDHRLDYCRVTGSADAANEQAACVLSVAGGFTEGAKSEPLVPGATRTWADFNGDGKADFCRITASNIATCTISNGTNFAAPPAPVVTPTPDPSLVQGENSTPIDTSRGPTNGAGATDQAKLTLGWRGAKGATRTVNYGSAATVIGQVVSSAGAPIGGASIDIAISGRKLPTPSTGSDGRFSLTLPKTLASSTLTLRYRSHLLDTAAAATGTVTLKVRAGVKLSGSPKLVRGRKLLKLRGKLLGGHIPKRGKLVVVQGRVGKRGPFRDVRTVRSSGHGSFSMPYRFTYEGGATFQFRARAYREAGYPFETGNSKPITIRHLR